MQKMKKNLLIWLNTLVLKAKWFNVTIPFKKIANDMVDIKINNNQSFVHDELMAINTIKIIDDKLIGYNTDFLVFFPT